MPKRPTPAAPVPELLDYAAAAALLNTGERHLKNLVYRRKIDYVKVGKYVRFRRADLLAYIDAHTVRADVA